MASAATTPALQSVVPCVDDARDQLLHIPFSAHTLSGFRAWVDSPEFPQAVRATFIAGEIFLDMSKEDPRLHVRIKDQLVIKIGQLVADEDLGEFYGDGMGISNEEAELSTIPDGSFYLWETLESGRIRLVQREGEESFVELEGTLDWVVEVVSRCSVTKDRQRLRAAYHRAGVAEYWLVDVRGAEVDFQILYRRKNGYVAAPVKDGWQKSRVFGRDFRFTRKRTRSNLVDHTLEMR